ncbi:PREDICTED: uncharacterized protein LOC104789708 [Camelina sativa]|uniref:Uncharacterized protein LOC104789708 n=1 Tax=Camelina sativa TaxID=90675 RepID=A0ABM0ZC80_CAMSA|nr:PREDICTED: uncharacterized protein LOC104789708 [Camelina sativa]
MGWLTTCFSSPSFSVALNGELVGYFQGKKGLRQGDSISAPLFTLVMDILSKKLDIAAVQNSFKPHPLCVDPLITHLSFADDLLVFFDGTKSSLAAILDVLENFKVISGLGVNLAKSCLFLDGNDISGIASRQGLSHGALPVRYLGVPLITQKLSPTDYQPLIDKVKGRISGWTHRHLSFAVPFCGRECQIQLEEPRSLGR